MNQKKNIPSSELYTRSEIFRDLMSKEIREILLISSRFNIFNLEEDGSLTSKIMNEYKGLNLCYPPRITGAVSVNEAMSLLRQKDFDMVIIVPHLEETDVFSLGADIKRMNSSLPVILLSAGQKETSSLPQSIHGKCIDTSYTWSGNPDLLLAMVKNAEDHLNVEQDTRLANVRVVILVEDSPEYYSFFLPIIYKELVNQTHAVMQIRHNDNEKLHTIRTRPKILLARNYEEAMSLFVKYRSQLLGVISDTRLPRKGKTDKKAGIELLAHIRKKAGKIPFLLMSSEPENRTSAEKMSCEFLDKNSPDLLNEIHQFFQDHLGFGDFVFRMPDGHEIDRAANLRQLESKLHTIPDVSILHHANRNHFSNWLMARSEIALAMEFRKVKSSDFMDCHALRRHIISNVHELRKLRQKGIISTFDKNHFDPDIREFVKIGNGSLGGKARGLAFMSSLYRQFEDLQKKYPEITIRIPGILVISTDVYNSFLAGNNLHACIKEDMPDETVDERFLNAHFSEELMEQLEVFLTHITYPLAIRSSSQLEDGHVQPYAGVYRTYKIPNNHTELSVRLSHLVKAIKLVYASTCYSEPKAFHRNMTKRPFSDSMAVIVQEMSGNHYGDYFYPAVSGVAQSYNYYPFSHMKAEEGIIHIALGLGKTVMDGETSLRFSPRYPNTLPQFSCVEEILKNTQQYFYALKVKNYPDDIDFRNNSNLEKRHIDDAKNEFPIKALASTYVSEENRIRDTWDIPGPKVMTFAPMLKYNTFPLAELLTDLTELGRKSLGCPVEIEFAVNLHPEKSNKSELSFLQIRPMVTDIKRFEVNITDEDVKNSFCYSCQALGNGITDDMSDIVYVKPDDFRPEATIQIADEINRINAGLQKENRSYLLVGPGRWGSSDRWLGIPVKWRNISGVGAIIELRNGNLNADPSQGSHFFNNITSLGIHYITVNEYGKESKDYLDWQWLSSLPAISETSYTRHVRLGNPMMLKIDGRNSHCVMLHEKRFA